MGPVGEAVQSLEHVRGLPHPVPSPDTDPLRHSVLDEAVHGDLCVGWGDPERVGDQFAVDGGTGHEQVASLHAPAPRRAPIWSCHPARALVACGELVDVLEVGLDGLRGEDGPRPGVWAQRWPRVICDASMVMDNIAVCR